MSDDLVIFAEPDAPAPGSTVGPWLLLQRVDSGSYGMVFLAQRAGHPESPPVALKMARQPRDPRFEREGLLLQLMHHPGIPRYEDSGLWTSPQGHRYPYVVMECIRGFTLYDWFREQPRSSRQVLQVLAQAPRKVLRPRELATVALELEGIILRLISEEGTERGTATQIAEALERAAQQAGPAADDPILPTSAAVPTEKEAPRFSSRSSSSSQPSRPRPSSAPERRSHGTVFPIWLSWASAAVIGGLLVLVGSEVRHGRESGTAPLPAIAETWNMPHDGASHAEGAFPWPA